ncbi:beta family protein, partial [Caminibacter pacificus]
MIDIPNYLSNNKVIEKHNLLDPQKRFEFIQSFNDNIIPIISFHYTNNLKESKKNNIKFFKLIFKNYENFAIRLFTDTTYISEDKDIFENIMLFFEDEIKERSFLILDVNQKTKKDINSIINYNIKKTILINDILNNGSHQKEIEKENFYCLEINNSLLSLSKELKCEYGDYTVVDKIPKYEEDEKKGFILYTPYLYYTTKSGNICKFKGKKAGDMSEYKRLCTQIVHHPDYEKDHCNTCKDIFKLYKGEDIKYKAGATWKHRMITHHITTMAELLND